MAEIPREVTLVLNRVLSDTNNRAMLAYLTSVVQSDVWEPGVSYDQMMIREGGRRMARDILLAAKIDTIDPYLAVRVLGGNDVRRTEHPEQSTHGHTTPAGSTGSAE